MTLESNPALRLGRLAAILPVSDMPAAAALYRSLFGLETVFENGDPVGFMILRRDEMELHLSLHPGHQAPPFNVAHLLVSDAAALQARCRALGLRLIKPLEDKDYGLRAFVFEDPDGNRIDIGEPFKATG